MSGRPMSQSGLMAHRKDVVKDDEPLFTETRNVQDQSEYTYSHTIPKQAGDLLGLAKGDQVEIHIYEDGYFVTTVEDGDE